MKVQIIISLFTVGIIFQSAVAKSTVVKTQWLSPDLQITQVNADEISLWTNKQAQEARLEDCRANIKAIMCLVDPQQNDQDLHQRSCLPGGEVYAQDFEKLFDRFSAPIQKMFCSLKRIYVEKEFFATAYASIIKANNQVIGATIGFRKAFLDSKPSLSYWASWKEQLSFGGNPKQIGLIPGLPLINAQSEGEFSDFLYFVAAHEFGHIFDFTNNLNVIDDCNWQDDHYEGACLPQIHSWSELSWMNIQQPSESNDFPLRSSLCFYECGAHPISVQRADELFTGLLHSNFISTYASSNPWEDFADTFSYYTLAKNMNFKYAIETGSGHFYDIRSHLGQPIMKSKIDYIDKFLSGPIIYPGQN